MFEIRPSARHGRGLFATRDVEAGQLVAVSPVLVLDAEDRATVEDTAVGHMLVEWGEDGAAAIPLGDVALVNHSEAPNCELVTDATDAGPNVELWSCRPVACGEELTIDYVAGSDGPLWFDPA